MNKTLTKQVLELLAGRKLTSAEIQKELGIDYTQFRSLMAHLQARRYVESAPVTYGLSAKGSQHLVHTPKGTPEELAKARARREKVAEAKRSRPSRMVSSVFNLGAHL